MDLSLQLGINQQLTLTPQLQQAIRLLQLSTLDLQREIEEVIQSNPMLEASSIEEKSDTSLENSKQTHDESSDFQWSQLCFNQGKRSRFDDPDFNYESLYCTTTNLQDHLRWQLDLTPMSEIDRMIAVSLIDAVDDDGFLTLSLDELYSSLNSETHPLDFDEIEAVRHRLQQFDPVSCVSVNLAEVLFVQLSQLPLSDDVALAKRIIRNDIELLGQHNYQQLMKNYRVNEVHLNCALQIIQRLNPKPGGLIYKNTTQYIIPDVLVKKIAGVWHVSLNNNTLPRLSINNQYASLIQRADNSADNQFLKNNLQEARWFLKSIESRQETLLKVAQCIVEYQLGFLEHGDESMRPLILNDVASVLNMHESTISRVTTQKFMHTPRGVFELKYFFSSHVTTLSGGECSSTAIRAVIKKLIAAENRKKPLSDSIIAQLLCDRGIQVARRTVAKYRESIGILPSNERKSIL